MRSRDQANCIGGNRAEEQHAASALATRCRDPTGPGPGGRRVCNDLRQACRAPGADYGILVVKGQFWVDSGPHCGIL
jgi:hypothetical protein